jgi:hypothetical protein
MKTILAIATVLMVLAVALFFAVGLDNPFAGLLVALLVMADMDGLALRRWWLRQLVHWRRMARKNEEFLNG